MAETQLCEAEDNLQRENLFTLLRQAIKAKGYTYARLACEMQVSAVSYTHLTLPTTPYV